MPKQISGIYRILNTINGKSYVGSAIDSDSRWYFHRYELKKSIHHSDHLQKAVNKYGIENFEFNVIETIENPTKELLEDRENYWIQFYDSANPEKGYNICPKAGTSLGFKHTEETLKHLKEIKSGKNNPRFGTKHTEETKQKMSKSQTGKKISAEAKNKMRLAKLGKKLSPERCEQIRQRTIGGQNPFFGKHHTEEANEKNRQAHLGKPSPNKGNLKQFCSMGHDTFIVGRIQHRCRECNRIREKLRIRRK
jgi:group I intron endonuclease